MLDIHHIPECHFRILRCWQERNATCGQEGCSKLWITTGAKDRPERRLRSSGRWGNGATGASQVGDFHHWWMNNDDDSELLMNITFFFRVMS